MTRKKIGISVLAVMVLLFCTGLVFAQPLTGEYTIEVIATQTGVDSWNFTYNVTNINQQAPTYPYTGLDGFWVQVPETATVSNVVNPSAYWGWGYWGSGQGADPFIATPDADLSSGYT